jgi:dolichol-phosphate mannosyltransferase
LIKNLIIIPTYNERENISKMIDAVLSQPLAADLLVVDDGSPDGTADIVKSRFADFPDRLFILERKGKLGLGTAYIAGFKWGIAYEYDVIYEMDADFSHHPTDLNRLFEAIDQGADVAIGSRYVAGGKLENWPLDRIFISYGASLYVRIITWMNIKDPTAGFVAYRRPVLETIDLDRIRFIGYAFQIEMKYAAHTLGYKLKEVPITFTERVEGTSKMSKGIIKEAIQGVIIMRWQSFFASYRKRLGRDIY